jgi:hypothetical protein
MFAIVINNCLHYLIVALLFQVQDVSSFIQAHQRGCKNYDNYFKKKFDATGKEGLSALQKCVAAIRILAYGVPAGAVDEYMCIAESTAQSLQHFYRAVIDVFGPWYLRHPNAVDVARRLSPRTLIVVKCLVLPAMRLSPERLQILKPAN